jgi:hypothetical protein
VKQRRLLAGAAFAGGQAHWPAQECRQMIAKAVTGHEARIVVLMRLAGGTTLMPILMGLHGCLNR